MDTGDTLKCPHCNSTINIRNKFCLNCGQPVGKLCSKCGILLAANAKFCGECGTRVTSAPQLQTEALLTYTCQCGAVNKIEAKFCQECGEPSKYMSMFNLCFLDSPYAE